MFSPKSHRSPEWPGTADGVAPRSGHAWPRYNGMLVASFVDDHAKTLPVDQPTDPFLWDLK
jgi:hypothetical protein